MSDSITINYKEKISELVTAHEQDESAHGEYAAIDHDHGANMSFINTYADMCKHEQKFNVLKQAIDIHKESGRDAGDNPYPEEPHEVYLVKDRIDDMVRSLLNQLDLYVQNWEVLVVDVTDENLEFPPGGDAADPSKPAGILDVLDGLRTAATRIGNLRDRLTALMDKYSEASETLSRINSQLDHLDNVISMCATGYQSYIEAGSDPTIDPMNLWTKFCSIFPQEDWNE